MADFYGCLESTSFRVKDRTAFLNDPDVKKLQEWVKDREGFFEEQDGYFAFGYYDQYPQIIMNYFGESEEDEELELDMSEIIQRHIHQNDACQIGVSGNEKLRYIGGIVCWITSKGVAVFDGTTAWDDKLTPDSLLTIARKTLEDTMRIAA